MIDLHYWPTPNGKKVTILLEECALPYQIVPCNIGKGDQFTPAFLGISPNNRMPAMVDHDPASGHGLTIQTTPPTQRSQQGIAAGGDFVTDELRGYGIANCRFKIANWFGARVGVAQIVSANFRFQISDFSFRRCASHVFAQRNELHLGGDDSLSRIIELRDGATCACAERLSL